LQGASGKRIFPCIITTPSPKCPGKAVAVNEGTQPFAVLSYRYQTIDRLLLGCPDKNKVMGWQVDGNQAVVIIIIIIIMMVLITIINNNKDSWNRLFRQALINPQNHVYTYRMRGR